jgi:hypothetical protein
MPNFMKILSVGTELFQTDRRTNMTKLLVAFRNFANAPKKLSKIWAKFEVKTTDIAEIEIIFF